MAMQMLPSQSLGRTRPVRLSYPQPGTSILSAAPGATPSSYSGTGPQQEEASNVPAPRLNHAVMQPPALASQHQHAPAGPAPQRTRTASHNSGVSHNSVSGVSHNSSLQQQSPHSHPQQPHLRIAAGGSGETAAGGAQQFQTPLHRPTGGSAGAGVAVETIESTLSEIFDFYATRPYSRSSKSVLKSMKFQKMALDSDLVDENGLLTSARIDLIFKKLCGNQPTMTFESFMNACVQIALVKYPGENKAHHVGTGSLVYGGMVDDNSRNVLADM